MTKPSDADVFAGMRDATCFRNPGRAGRYHIQRGDGFAVCGVDGFLHDAVHAQDVHEVLRCKRSGCATRWPAEAP